MFRKASGVFFLRFLKFNYTLNLIYLVKYSRLLRSTFTQTSPTQVVVKVILKLSIQIPKFRSHIFLKYYAHVYSFIQPYVRYFSFFRQTKALKNYEKSSKKLFSFSSYSIFSISILPSFFLCRPLLKRMIEDKSYSL